MFQSDSQSVFLHHRSDVASRMRFDDARVLPVYSCWNGMIAMDARPFLGIGLHGEDLGEKAVKFRGARRDMKECGRSQLTVCCGRLW
jgi:hypothetical protein